MAWRITWLQEKLTGKPSLVTRETADQSSHIYYYPADKSKTVFEFQYRKLSDSINEIANSYQLWKKDGDLHPLKF